MVSTSPSESITTPLPSRCGPRVRSERALETAWVRTFTTESDSTVSCGWPAAGGGAGAVCARAASGAQTSAAISNAGRMNSARATGCRPGASAAEP